MTDDPTVDGSDDSLRSYRSHWAHLVTHWTRGNGSPTRAQARDLLDRGLEPLVAELPAERGEHTWPSQDELLRCEVAVVRASGQLDEAGYAEANADVRRGKVGAVEHFCSVGWQSLCNPSLDFDVWWYWAEYLDPTVADVNPLVHFLVWGGRRGHLPVQMVEARRRAQPLAAPPRRVCLFAGYDPDGELDDYVLHYLRELARHCDVYYLADGYMDPEDLARLADVTKGAWAIAHGGYDFGSYSILARDLVGWDVLQGYDEVVLANDSAFLLRPLDEVFGRMEDQACDWWGMQASKHDFDYRSNGGQPISLSEAKKMVGQRFMNDFDHLHVSSYFLALRQPVIGDPGFRRRLEAVVPQQQKLMVVHKYEIGLSRYLMCRGFDFETFVPDLYPFHPLYTDDYFDLLSLGFPLLKRNFLSENSRSVLDLAAWKDRVLAAVPDARVEEMERNLLRVSADDKLQRSFALLSQKGGLASEPKPLSWWEFVEEDRYAPKLDHWWAFLVDDREHLLPGASRAVFEVVKGDPSIRKIVLTRGRRIEGLEGENVVVVPLSSRQGQHELARARHVFVHEEPRPDERSPVAPARHRVINLATPPVRRAEWALPMAGEDQPQESSYHAVVVSSSLERLVAAAAFPDLRAEGTWSTGNPRNDLVLCAPQKLPLDLRRQEQRLVESLAGRRLVLVELGYDVARGGLLRPFGRGELEWLGQWSKRNDVVIGYVEDPRDRARSLTQLLRPIGARSLTRREHPSLEVVDRVAAAFLTDRPTRAAEFSVTGRPVATLVDGYAVEDLAFDPRSVLPGAVCEGFEDLVAALEQMADVVGDTGNDVDAWKRSLLHEHQDTQNAHRLVVRLRADYVAERLGAADTGARTRTTPCR